jgi:SAM-dependent methyltransferase
MRHDLVDQQYPLEPDPAFRRRAAWLLQELESLPKGATVLDIGCGQGFYLPLYARLGLSASGVEPDPVPRAQAQKTALMPLALPSSVPPPNACPLPMPALTPWSCPKCWSIWPTPPPPWPKRRACWSRGGFCW